MDVGPADGQVASIISVCCLRDQCGCSLLTCVSLFVRACAYSFPTYKFCVGEKINTYAILPYVSVEYGGPGNVPSRKMEDGRTGCLVQKSLSRVCASLVV